jgi:hypothetical protein
MTPGNQQPIHNNVSIDAAERSRPPFRLDISFSAGDEDDIADWHCFWSLFPSKTFARKQTGNRVGSDENALERVRSCVPSNFSV